MEGEEHKVKAEVLLKENTALKLSVEEGYEWRKRCIEREAETNSAKVVRTRTLISAYFLDSFCLLEKCIFPSG